MTLSETKESIVVSQCLQFERLQVIYFIIVKIDILSSFFNMFNVVEHASNYTRLFPGMDKGQGMS